MDFRIHFHCQDCLLPSQSWEGWLEPLGSLQSVVTEMKIKSHSTFYAIVGDTGHGHFICLPNRGAGLFLADYTDFFWNRERLVELLGSVDGITVAFALKAAHKVGII